RSSAAGRCARSSTRGPPTSRGGGGDAAASTPTADGRGRRAARASVREQSREEVLHARAEGVRTLLDAAALEVLPRALGRRRGRLARLLEFLAGELRALDDGVADALGRLLHARTDLAVPDLLGAGLDLTRRRLHFRLIRGDDRRRRPADDGDRRERDRQQSLGVHDAISLLTSRVPPRGHRGGSSRSAAAEIGWRREPRQRMIRRERGLLAESHDGIVLL